MTISLDRETSSAAGTAATGVTVSKIGGRIGARIDGVRLSGDLSPETVATIRAAILEHKVVFFRGQNHLDDEAQIAFAELLGPLTTAHPTVNTGSARVLALAANKGMAANSWHTDVTFVDRIPAFSVLRGVAIPAYGGTTNWANTVTAYETLPDALKALVDNLWATHTNDYDYAAQSEKAEIEHDQDNVFTRREFTRILFQTEHPVVRVHPETGERSLVLGHFVKSFVGLNTAESHALFQLLQARVTKLENTVRWTWAEGDVAIWDNRATQHYAVADFDEQYREVRRITVAGDVPVSIAGEHSRVVQGDATAFSSLDELIS
ncbi:taurine catabolism dioxygenase [Nocardioides sp. MAH-18]|uniref:Alpha-ketoglutarate-dependent sulfate ester dioxygenase n=1 Tax=Nocardioides agri TaxID=2682843 RepID=A0A6L6XXT3_9ACTN|nr:MULTISPECIES: TauD/TfdA family dioxygenase [unclassified Nocardioides]MBA2955445.1 TauD/TfdA family dioxygenase [Nocardioides sp. CGMCC 1.13656]MVQ50295.1 taurine catabolism dioxygenase [Nocardioides sp. MAH-18]